MHQILFFSFLLLLISLSIFTRFSIDSRIYKVGLTITKRVSIFNESAVLNRKDTHQSDTSNMCQRNNLLNKPKKQQIRLNRRNIILSLKWSINQWTVDDIRNFLTLEGFGFNSIPICHPCHIRLSRAEQTNRSITNIQFLQWNIWISNNKT